MGQNCWSKLLCNECITRRIFDILTTVIIALKCRKSNLALENIGDFQWKNSFQELSKQFKTAATVTIRKSENISASVTQNRYIVRRMISTIIEYREKFCSNFTSRNQVYNVENFLELFCETPIIFLGEIFWRLISPPYILWK